MINNYYNLLLPFSYVLHKSCIFSSHSYSFLRRISKTEFNKSSPTSVDNLLIASLYHSNSQGINRITLNSLDHIEKLFK